MPSSACKNKRITGEDCACQQPSSLVGMNAVGKSVLCGVSVDPHRHLENFNLHSFFFNDTATTEIYTLSLHDALPIYCGDCGTNRRPVSRSHTTQGFET